MYTSFPAGLPAGRLPRGQSLDSPPHRQAAADSACRIHRWSLHVGSLELGCVLHMYAAGAGAGVMNARQPVCKLWRQPGGPCAMPPQPTHVLSNTGQNSAWCTCALEFRRPPAPQTQVRGLHVWGGWLFATGRRGSHPAASLKRAEQRLYGRTRGGSAQLRPLGFRAKAVAAAE